jgi:hypothetical protein
MLCQALKTEQMFEKNAGRCDALHSQTLPMIPMMPAVKIWMIMPEAVIWPRVIPVTKIKLRGFLHLEYVSASNPDFAQVMPQQVSQNPGLASSPCHFRRP